MYYLLVFLPCLDLHVLGTGCGGGGAHAVCAEQPAAFLGAFDVGVAHKTEAEVDAAFKKDYSSEEKLKTLLSSKPARHGQVVGVAVAQAHVAQ